MKRYLIAIVGGGAAGLMAAALLSFHGQNNFILLERNERLGKKLSATGNGQGNLTNLFMDRSHYYSDDLEKAERVLQAFNEKEVLSFLESLGGFFEADERGRVYPASRQASSLTDLLRGYLSSRGVEVKTGFFVKEISFAQGFSLVGENEKVFADNVFLCGGGLAQKNFGSDGNAYAIAKSFSHSVTQLYPSLVQMKTDADSVKGLRGIRADVRLSAYENGKKIGSASGDVIFTDYGISGNAVFSLSSQVAGRDKVSLSIEFLPRVSRERLISAIQQKMRERKDIEKNELLGCFLNNQIGRNVMKRVKNYTAEEIVSSAKDYRLEYRGTLGFDSAQVTKGGIPLLEVDEKLQSKKQKGLYFCGEILNVDGDCGGYNLQWAFSSAYAAAKNFFRDEEGG